MNADAANADAVSADAANADAVREGLIVNDLVVHRSTSPVVRGVSLEVLPGEVTVLLGTNGAGKTTLLEAISGVIAAESGTATLDGVDITSLAREKRSSAGLAHVEQGRAVFPELTVEENLLVAGKPNEYTPILELFPELVERRAAKAGLLSGGEQQMLVIARSLVREPKVLMLDEMSLGLAPVIVKRLVPMVAQLAHRGVGILLVEQFAPLALSVGDRAYVLSRGEVAFAGECDALAKDPSKLRDIYLGASTEP